MSSQPNQWPIDFTQWNTYQQCPMLWWETYCRGWRKKPATYQREDALCIGSLYHDGQEQLLKTGTANITQKVIDEMTPKPEVLEMVANMLAEYSMWAIDPWQVITIEKPLEFEITDDNGDTVPCLAKLDASVLVAEPTTIETGQVGQTITLAPGYWTFEHKTKDPSSNRAAFLRRWELDGQPLFQQFGLRQHIMNNPHLPQLPVQGTIINVAEKPSIYVPVRTCKGCKTKQDFSSYEINGDRYVCRLCGYSNEFDPPKTVAQRKPTTFYRIALPAHRPDNPVTVNMMHSIVNTWHEMQLLRTYGPDMANDPYRGYTKCIHPIWGPCVFTDVHTGRIAIEDSVELHQIDTTKYMKETP